jgi:hypothetical protein
MSKQNPIRRLAASKIRDFSDRLLGGRKQEDLGGAAGPAGTKIFVIQCLAIKI